MIELDGSQGEGGGQVLRTALAASLVKGVPVRVKNIRAGRPEPGLKAQHLAAVKAAAAVGDAEVAGAELGSRDVTFEPKRIAAGDYELDIGTAGSAGLVLQTVLPALLLAPAASTLLIRGGTHNPLAPPFEFLEKSFVPVLAKLGAKIGLKLDRPGLYPEGGGKIRVTVEPASLKRLELLQRGEIRKRRAIAAVASLPVHIVERELKVIKHLLGWKQNELRAGDLTGARGMGNILLIEIESEHVTEVIFGIGAKNLRAERVAEQVAEDARRYIEAHVPVGEHLADQLMLPLAIGAGGTYRTLPLSGHSRTQIDVLRQLLGVQIRATQGDDGNVTVDVPSIG